MMKNSAFPVTTGSGILDCGLSRREYFAALSMIGIEAANVLAESLTSQQVVDRAVRNADALIAALNKTDSEQDKSTK